MAKAKQKSLATGNRPKQQGQSSLRTLAVLLMVLGAAAFVLSLVIYGEQVYCLVGSTLLTFVGLGLTVAARRQPPPTRYVSHPTDSPRKSTKSQPLQPSPLPEGRQQEPMPVTQAAPTPQVETETLAEIEPQAEPVLAAGLSSLEDMAVEAFQRWGGQVSIAAQREGRSLLHITAVDGRRYAAMVLDQPGQIEVAEVRALFAVITYLGGQGGFLITDGTMSSQAEQWAQQRRIALVDRSWLNGDGIDRNSR